MSIISSLKTYIATWTAGMGSSPPLWVDFLNPTPNNYEIVPLPGNRIVLTYLNGDSEREYPFAFQAMFSTADEAERLESNGFFETFADWLESQTLTGTLPTFTGTPTKTATAIEASGWAYLYEQGQSETGIYQIQCKLSYSQLA
jgi:hypothetical protein